MIQIIVFRINGELHGDPLDLILFNQTGWSLLESVDDEADSEVQLFDNIQVMLRISNLFSSIRGRQVSFILESKFIFDHFSRLLLVILYSRKCYTPL